MLTRGSEQKGDVLAVKLLDSTWARPKIATWTSSVSSINPSMASCWCPFHATAILSSPLTHSSPLMWEAKDHNMQLLYFNNREMQVWGLFGFSVFNSPNSKTYKGILLICLSSQSLCMLNGVTNVLQGRELEPLCQSFIACLFSEILSFCSVFGLSVLKQFAHVVSVL